jgi:sugar/nucleoside kinase (ribokinase family)
LPLEEVFDPTGAGDTFAGGFIIYAKTKDISFDNMKTAIIVEVQWLVIAAKNLVQLV